ncbi:cytochrome c oxidase subunit 2, partial [Chytridiales sp. JEL 0842]
YMMDEILDAEITVKAIGNQWYWSYEYSDYETPIAFDSFMKDEASLEFGELRQLAVDNYLVLPVDTSIRVKCDSIPGRLNSVGFIINRPSTYYGQCSELCGIMHAYMPIGIKAVTIPSYINFLDTAAE